MNSTPMEEQMEKRFFLEAYNRERAVEYARRWAFSRNPLFEDFAGSGGDCTNFVSQALLAGSCQMDTTKTFGWYFKSVSDRSPSWTGVEAFFDYITGSGDFPPISERPGPFGYPTEDAYVGIGDVVQLANEDGDFYHTLIITGLSEGEIFVSAHTNDALDRPLSSYSAPGKRFVRIAGVARTDGEPSYDCFERLMAGE